MKDTSNLLTSQDKSNAIASNPMFIFLALSHPVFLHYSTLLGTYSHAWSSLSFSSSFFVVFFPSHMPVGGSQHPLMLHLTRMQRQIWVRLPIFADWLSHPYVFLWDPHRITLFDTKNTLLQGDISLLHFSQILQCLFQLFLLLPIYVFRKVQ